MSTDANGLTRLQNGKFAPGNAGGGRLPGFKSISLLTTLRRKMEATAKRRKGRYGVDTSPQLVADQVIEELINLALTCRNPKVKLQAIMVILDRLEGKAVQPIAVAADSEVDLHRRCKLALEAVLQFAAANNLTMSIADAVGWVAAREPRAREVLADVLTIEAEFADSENNEAGQSE